MVVVEMRTAVWNRSSFTKVALPLGAAIMETPQLLRRMITTTYQAVAQICLTKTRDPSHPDASPLSNSSYNNRPLIEAKITSVQGGLLEGLQAWPQGRATPSHHRPLQQRINRCWSSTLIHSLRASFTRILTASTITRSTIFLLRKTSLPSRSSFLSLSDPVLLSASCKYWINPIHNCLWCSKTDILKGQEREVEAMGAGRGERAGGP